MASRDTPEPGGEILLYQTEDGGTRIECRFDNETIWLSQALIAELFQVTVSTVNEHLKGIYAEGELQPGATIRKFRIVRKEGSRQVSRDIEHYNLEAILAVGFRIRSHRGTQFRQWATARLQEYLVKGFVMDDERLKNPPGTCRGSIRCKAIWSNSKSVGPAATFSRTSGRATEMVLDELLTALSPLPERAFAIRGVDAIRTNPNVEVVPHPSSSGTPLICTNGWQTRSGALPIASHSRLCGREEFRKRWRMTVTSSRQGS